MRWISRRYSPVASIDDRDALILADPAGHDVHAHGSPAVADLGRKSTGSFLAAGLAMLWLCRLVRARAHPVFTARVLRLEEQLHLAGAAGTHRREYARAQHEQDTVATDQLTNRRDSPFPSRPPRGPMPSALCPVHLPSPVASSKTSETGAGRKQKGASASGAWPRRGWTHCVSGSSPAPCKRSTSAVPRPSRSHLANSVNPSRRPQSHARAHSPIETRGTHGQARPRREEEHWW
jgi:hypothetical protein